MKRWALCVPLAAMTACAPDVAERPTAPNLSDLVAAYATPTAELSSETAQALVTAIPSRVQSLADVVSLVAVVSGSVGGFSGIEVDENGLRRSGLSTETGEWSLSAEAGGWVELRRRCPGWNQEDRRGVLTLRALVEPSGVSEAIWGEVDGCRAVDESGHQFEYHGEIALWAPGLASGPIVFSIEGDVRDAEGTRAFGLDFQMADQAVLLKHELDDGSRFLIGVAKDGAEGLRILDAYGLWSCDTSGCALPDGETLSW